VSKVALWAVLVLALSVPLGSAAVAETSSHPLQPLDRTNPRATLKSFLDSGDELTEFVAREYFPTPTLQEFSQMLAQSQLPVSCLDLRDIPSAARKKTGGAATLALYDTLNRIELPSWEEIPGAREVDPNAENPIDYWVIPNTEIILVRVPDDLGPDEFLFSDETVSRADEFYQQVRDLPLTRPVVIPNFGRLMMEGGGWPIRLSWIEVMPAWLRAPLLGQSIWKWIALLGLLGLFSIPLRMIHRFSRSVHEEYRLKRALARLALPVYFVAVTPILAVLALVQINMFGAVASTIQIIAVAVTFFFGAWLSWRAAPVIAEAMISAPGIKSESIDAYVLRLTMRLLGLAGALVLLVMGAERIGVPAYGIIAGLGVGGLAIALAAQPTVENLIGTLSLFADRPVRVGDRCQYGDRDGFVESIGIRSTRIRGFDRKVTTIPNRELSNMALVNFSERDRRLIRTTIGIRYETTPDQLRFLLAKLREMLLAHPQIHPEIAQVRLIGFGESSLNVEIFTYAMTRDRTEFYAILEDVCLRIMDIVEESGTSFAFPSRTLYFNRDGGLNDDRAEQARTEVRKWRSKGELPFPFFSDSQVDQFKDSLDYPPQGSTGATRKMALEEELEESQEPSDDVQTDEGVSGQEKGTDSVT
jgi:MscS family membrane protein